MNAPSLHPYTGRVAAFRLRAGHRGSPRFLDEQSDPGQAASCSPTSIHIRQPRPPARLLDRHWLITDGNGKVEEVRGEGVVGEQPGCRTGRSLHHLGRGAGANGRHHHAAATASSATTAPLRRADPGIHLSVPCRCTEDRTVATWAIGDLQGLPRSVTSACWRRDPVSTRRDRLWFCGDLVNRGGQSVKR